MLETLKVKLEEAKAEYAKPHRRARAEKAAAHSRKVGVRHQISCLVEVRAGDIVAAADTVKDPDPWIRNLRDGSDAGKPDRMVMIQLEDLERLVEACSGSGSPSVSTSD